MHKVLVIEDEPLLRTRIAKVLRTNGYDVVEAENGKQAIDKLQENGIPCVVILDMVMPDMNGWGFLDFQRNHPEYRDIPVIIVSAFEGMARSAKPQAYLPKPVESDDLLKSVAHYCA